MNCLIYDNDIISNNDLTAMIEIYKSKAEKKVNVYVSLDDNQFENDTKEFKNLDLIFYSLRLDPGSWRDKIKYLRKTYPDSKIYIIGGSDLTDEVIKDGVLSGANNYLSKPYDREIIEKIIKGVLNNE